MRLHDLIDAEPYLSFHDGTFERVCLDYVAHEASITCLLFMGDPDAPSQAEREAQRRGVLTLTGLLYFVIEPPHPKYPFDTAEGLDITADDAIASLPQPLALPSVEDYEAFTHYFFVNDWNAHLRRRDRGQVRMDLARRVAVEHALHLTPHGVLLSS